MKAMGTETKEEKTMKAIGKVTEATEVIKATGGVHKDSELAIGKGKSTASSTNKTFGISAMGSKAKVVPQIQAIINESVRKTGAKSVKFYDICTGGGYVAYNALAKIPEDVEIKVYANDLERGMINFHRALKKGQLEEMLVMADEQMRVLHEQLAPVAEQEGKALDKVSFEFLAKNYHIGDGCVEFEERIPDSSSVIGYKDIVKDELVSASLTYVAIYASRSADRVTFSKDDYREIMKQVTLCVESIKKGDISFNALVQDPKFSRIKGLAALQDRLSEISVEFTCKDANEVLSQMEPQSGELRFIFADPPYLAGKGDLKYSNTEFSSSVESQFRLAAKLMKTKSPFILCCDTSSVNALSALAVFDDIRIYRTSNVRHRVLDNVQDNIYDCIITNIDMSGAEAERELADIAFEQYKRACRSSLGECRSFDVYFKDEHNKPLFLMTELKYTKSLSASELKSIFKSEGCECLLEKADLSKLNK